MSIGPVDHEDARGDLGAKINAIEEQIWNASNAQVCRYGRYWYKYTSRGSMQ